MKILDLINPRLTEVPYTLSTFPDGQPHIKIELPRNGEAVEIVSRAAGPGDLFTLAITIDAASRNAYADAPVVNVNISYLIGGRMDRPIGWGQPATVLASTGALAEMGGRSHADSEIRILDPHSSSSLYSCLGGIALPMRPNILLDYVRDRTFRAAEGTGKAPVVIAPDAGSLDRATYAAKRMEAEIGHCTKHRAPDTGILGGFSYDGPIDLSGRVCIIVDDICDGGGTFVGIARELRKAGAARVVLCVTHGIMSKGLPLEGIDSIYTTDSFQSFNGYAEKTGGIIDPHTKKLFGAIVLTDYLHREVRSQYGGEA